MTTHPPAGPVTGGGTTGPGRVARQAIRRLLPALAAFAVTLALLGGIQLLTHP